MLLLLSTIEDGIPELNDYDIVILHCIAYFDLPECVPLPSSFSQGPMVADESINASIASYHRLGVPGVDMAYSAAENNSSVRCYSYE